MTKFKKASAVIALTAASTLAIFGGRALLDDVQFARADAKVQATSQELESVTNLSDVFRKVGEVVEPSVVRIDVKKTIKGVGLQAPNEQLKKFFEQHGLAPNIPLPDGGDDNGDDQAAPDQGLEEAGTGSGVIIETDGSTAYILTNNHVAGGASDITVTLSDGRVIKGGKTIGADAKADLAVVKIHAPHVIPAKWGDSDSLERGDWVLAFGSPFGYIGSMTHGIVSALNRQAGILGNSGYENFIQVDAPINPGNSGGPLVDIHGHVVGINTAIASRSGSFSGIGFAIPSDQAKEIYKMLKDKGHVTRGWLGVGIIDVSRKQQVAKSFGYDAETGVLVQEVLPNTPAIGKLQAGDIITSIDGKDVADVQALRNHVAMIAPGTTVKLGVFRDSKQTEVPLTIGQQPDDTDTLASAGGAAPKSNDANAETAETLGMHLSDMSDELAQKYGLGEQHGGAVITAVKPKSLAAQSQLMPGDLITLINGKKVANASQAAEALSKFDPKKGATLYVTNAQGSGFVFIGDQDQ
jgi:serine protease Do